MSITKVTSIGLFLVVAGVFLVVGLVFGAAGFFQWNLHPDRLMSWLS